MTLHSHNPDFCSDFCILILNIAQNFHCACATNLWMHALFTAEHQRSPNYFLIFQSSSAFLLLVLALSRLVVEKHKLFNSLESQWKRKVVHMIMILLFCYHHNFSFLEQTDSDSNCLRGIFFVIKDSHHSFISVLFNSWIARMRKSEL